jgi:hypothetical protein
MNVKKEVYAVVLNVIDKELTEAKWKLNRNRNDIRKLAEHQRILKSEIGKLYELRKTLKP